MMTFGMSEAQYDISSVNITYGKLIDKLIEDFITREDAKQMMSASNLSVTTSVDTTVNTILTGTAGPAPIAGTGLGKGSGAGSGQVIASYKGDTASAGSQVTKAKRKREKLTGQTETSGTLDAINIAAGGDLS